MGVSGARDHQFRGLVSGLGACDHQLRGPVWVLGARDHPSWEPVGVSEGPVIDQQSRSL